MELGLTTLAWSPLGGGRLGDGPAAGVQPELIATLDRLAEREGAERASVALAFVLCHPASPVPLIGTQQPERIKAAVASLHVRLDRRDVYEIVQASDGAPLP
jgi:predicted oxidoreductase